jgi:3,4-dihydroxy 2-butanone 4-phosphate synthase/GTP cyclohydrolase II
MKNDPECLIEHGGTVKMPSRYADRDFDLHCYISTVDRGENIALVFGDIGDGEDVLVRVHSECLTGDVFHSARCDCGDQLEKAMQAVVGAGRGIMVYLRQEGRGIGLINKIKAYDLQDRCGLDTVDANIELGFPPDNRDYRVAGQILLDLGVKSLRLMTNNPKKIAGILACGIPVNERIPHVVPPRDDNRDYLLTKQEKLGHFLEIE